MKRHLFYTFLYMFIATCVVTLLGATHVISMDEWCLKSLLVAFLLALAGAVVALFKGAKFFADDDKPAQQALAQLQKAHQNEIAERDRKEAQGQAKHAQAVSQIKGAADEEINRLDAANRQLVSKNAALIENNKQLVSDNAILNTKLDDIQKVEFFEHELGLKFKRSRETDNEWRLVCQRCGKQAIVNYSGGHATVHCASGCDYFMFLPHGTTPESIDATLPF